MAQINYKIKYWTKKMQQKLTHRLRRELTHGLKRAKESLCIQRERCGIVIRRKLAQRLMTNANRPSPFSNDVRRELAPFFFLLWFMQCHAQCFMLTRFLFNKHNYNLSSKVLRLYKSNLKLQIFTQQSLYYYPIKKKLWGPQKFGLEARACCDSPQVQLCIFLPLFWGSFRDPNAPLYVHSKSRKKKKTVVVCMNFTFCTNYFNLFILVTYHVKFIFYIHGYL